MKASDITLSTLIILFFIGILVLNVMTIGISKIKKNWPLYRCNPTVMPFASYFGHEPISNFTYCVQNMQTSYMSYLMEPTHYILGVFHNMLGGLMTDIQWIRKKILSLVTNIESIIGSIFSVFINIIIEFQRIFIKLKDMVAKILGVMATMVYLLESSMKTGESVMAGPIGEALRFVCFHPDTPIVMDNGSIIPMKMLKTGDLLRDGNRVMATMNILGNAGNDQHSMDNPYYRIYDTTLNDYIYVTGSHYIFDLKKLGYVQVKDYPDAKLCLDIKTDEFCCLVTSTHKINIGNHVFWDWEDNLLQQMN
jgi:hypothetical protein